MKKASGEMYVTAERKRALGDGAQVCWAEWGINVGGCVSWGQFQEDLTTRQRSLNLI